MNINHLLNLISKITAKYIAKTNYTGENFNIFSILKLTGDEVRLHSRFIGELLNPSGTHNKGSKFLELFLNEINLLNIYTQDQLNKAELIIEENIGGITDNYEEGGRIDLVIKFLNTENHIVIENKIWASDQPKQLWRYHSRYEHAHILYLTPKKRFPSEDSLYQLTKDDIITITYENHVRKWIEACLKESVNHPLLREVLNQYLNTIKIIIQQTNIQEMNQEIIDQIIDSGNIESALTIAKCEFDLKLRIFESFKTHLKNFSEINQLEIEFWDEKTPLGQKDSAFLFNFDDKYSVDFYFEGHFSNLKVGFIEKKVDDWIPDSSDVRCVNFIENFDHEWENLYNGDKSLLSSILTITKKYFEEIKIHKAKERNDA